MGHPIWGEFRKFRLPAHLDDSQYQVDLEFLLVVGNFRDTFPLPFRNAFVQFLRMPYLLPQEFKSEVYDQLHLLTRIFSEKVHNARLSGEQRNAMFPHTTLITKFTANHKCHALRIRLKALVMCSLYFLKLFSAFGAIFGCAIYTTKP
ncbi:hypothetical protein VCSRO134_3383 [Vibrio cholerae]|nr:hypothetical protein VCSRO134_3383 [Vibrio cholerae]